MLRRGIFLVIIGMAWGIFFTTPVYAQSGPAWKLGRGVANIATGWLEFPLEIGRKCNTQGDVAGLFAAPFTGFVKAIKRTAVGFYDTFTFFLPVPKDYKSLILPEFVLEDNFYKP